MTVKELIFELEKYPENLEVFTKKEDIAGNIGEVSAVKKDRYSSFGEISNCVLIGDFENYSTKEIVTEKECEKLIDEVSENNFAKYYLGE